MRKAFLLFIGLLFCLFVNGQLNKDVLLINGYKHLGKNFYKHKFGLEFDARNTFINSKKSKLGGLKLGVYVNRVNYFGLGLYGTSIPLEIERLPNSDLEIYSANVEFSYISLFYERILYFNPKWEWSATSHFGSGEIKVKYLMEENGKILNLDPILTKPFELSSSLYYHLNYWISIGGGYGYRVMRKTPSQLKPMFNGSIYLVKLKVRVVKKIKSIYNKGVKDEY